MIWSNIWCQYSLCYMSYKMIFESFMVNQWTMSSLSANEDCIGWAARDASGFLSPYSFNRRYIFSSIFLRGKKKKKKDYSSLKMLMNSNSYSNWLYIVDSKCKLESKSWKKKSYWFFSICYSFKCLTSLDSTFLSKFYARIDNSTTGPNEI